MPATATRPCRSCGENHPKLATGDYLWREKQMIEVVTVSGQSVLVRDSKTLGEFTSTSCLLTERYRLVGEREAA